MINLLQPERPWGELDEQERTDLIEWYNIATLDTAACKRLARLLAEGRFFASDCGGCGDRILRGEPGDDWAHFQGVCQDEGSGGLCSDCYGRYLTLAEFARE